MAWEPLLLRLLLPPHLLRLRQNPRRLQSRVLRPQRQRNLHQPRRQFLLQAPRLPRSQYHKRTAPLPAPRSACILLRWFGGSPRNTTSTSRRLKEPVRAGASPRKTLKPRLPGNPPRLRPPPLRRQFLRRGPLRNLRRPPPLPLPATLPHTARSTFRRCKSECRASASISEIMSCNR